MLNPVRRVVTGLDAEGRSTVLFDGVAGAQGEAPDWPGMGVTLLWRSLEVPADNSGNVDAAAGPFGIMKASRGTEFLIWQCPPLSELEKLTPQQRANALSPKGMIDAAQVDPNRHPGMHATNTLDFLVVLRGELTLILEGGETTLHAGDTLVGRGSAHAWENRGTETAICAIVNVGAHAPNNHAGVGS